MKNTKLNKIINQLIKEVLAEDFPDIEAKNYPEALANQMGMEDLDIIYDNLIDEYDEKEAIAQLANLLYNNMGNQDDIIEAIEKSKLNEEVKIALIDEVNDIFEEKNDQNRFDESFNRMKKLAGIKEYNSSVLNKDYNNKYEQFERMEGLANIPNLIKLKTSLGPLAKDWYDEGFEKEDIVEYLEYLVDEEL